MLHVSLLGEQGITEDGTSVQARSSRAVALVAFLAVHAGTPQSRQRIAGTFWPESTDAQALTNLRRELHHLRRRLGAAWLCRPATCAGALPTPAASPCGSSPARGQRRSRRAMTRECSRTRRLRW